MNGKLTDFNLTEWVKRQLGYPTRDVELTEEQLQDAVNFALQEVQPWYTIPEYITLDLNNRSAIDLSEYHIFEITDIIKIPTNLGNTNIDDPFSYNGYGMNGYGVAAGGYINTSIYISRLTNSDIHHVISSYAKQYNEIFYARLAQILAQRTAGTILPSMNYEFDRNTGWLYIGTGYPPSTVITIEYIPYIDDFTKIRDNRYKRCAQDLALGQAMAILARVVGKYSVSNAPTTINYDIYQSQSESLIEHAREELKRIALNNVVID